MLKILRWWKITQFSSKAIQRILQSDSLEYFISTTMTWRIIGYSNAHKKFKPITFKFANTIQTFLSIGSIKVGKGIIMWESLCLLTWEISSCICSCIWMKILMMIFFLTRWTFSFKKKGDYHLDLIVYLFSKKYQYQWGLRIQWEILQK